MEIDIEQLDDIVIVRIHGELNQNSSPALQEMLAPYMKPGCKILLDMSNLTYLSSAGLRILLLLYRKITNDQGDVVLTNLTDMVEDTMSITGFLTFFKAYKSVESGVSALNHQSDH